MDHHRGVLIPALAALLSGCAVSHPGPQRGAGPRAADLFGSALVLEQPVTIPGNTSHVTFANGRQVSKFERFVPWCEFEVNSLSRESRTAPAGRYPIARVYNRMAQDEYTGFWRILDFNENMFAITTVRFRDPSGEVRALTCRKEFPSGLYVRFPTREQINAILGPTLRLE